MSNILLSLGVFLMNILKERPIYHSHLKVLPHTLGVTLTNV